MKKNLLAATILLLGASLTGYAQGQSAGYISKTVQATPFQAIAIEGSADVIYKQGANQEIEISGSPNAVERLEVRTVNGTLTVGFKKGTRNLNYKKLEVKVSNPGINQIRVNGSGDVKLANGLKTNEPVKISINGSGDVEGHSIQCQELRLSVNGSGDIELLKTESQLCIAAVQGSGDITLSGTTQEAQLTSSGSGDIDATALKAKTVTASCNGSGDVGCYASEKLTIRKRGSGDVSYKGKPKEVVSTDRARQRAR
ncbi:MAG: DUF2807 domain-containing protein [Bacteroidia bacterium]|nr:DUF2807 domain-containing protein [Bacteroidia bacterium]